MSEGQPKVNLLGFDRPGLEAFVTGLGEKPFRARQLMQWIYHRGITEFAAMSDLGKTLRSRLNDCAEIRPPRILSEQRSADGTIKWLLSAGASNAVETVFIPEPKRGTLCISSQVGCMLNCTFCSTATQGFSRNLETSEITGQVWAAARALDGERPGRHRITNVVFMGMGEPLLNLDAVTPALSVLRDELGFGLAARRVTVSTAGVVPGIDRLRLEGPDVALAVSLHAPDDALRARLVPLNRKYPLPELLAACRRYMDGRKRASVTFEYTMIDGVNDGPAQARGLLKTLNGVSAKLNLIPFNPFPGTPFRTSPDERIRAFQEITRNGGIVTTVRRTRGEDIDAACGQLVGKVSYGGQRRMRIQQQLALRALA